jgi:capsular polysaccharide biosynthesis protein
VVGVGVLFGIGGLVYSLVMPPIYEASTTLYITSGTSVVPAVFDAVKASQERMPSYAHLAYSDAVLEPAIKSAGLSMSVEQARSALRVNPNPQYVLFNLAARDHNPDTAVRLANAVADSLVETVSRLEVPGAGGESTAKLSVVSTATVDSSPVEPKTVLNVTLPTLLGMAVGVLLVIAAERMNNKVRDANDAEHVVGAPILTTIEARAADEPRQSDSVLSDFADKHDPVAPRYRHVRSALLGSRNHVKRQILMIASPTVADKTTRISLNIAAACTQLNSRAVIVNTNFRNDSFAELSGCANKAGLMDIVAGRCDAPAAVEPTSDSRFPHLGVLNIGHTESALNPEDVLSSRHFGDIIGALCKTFDVVILDSPALRDSTAANYLVNIADTVAIVVNCGVTRISDLEATRDAIVEAGGDIGGIILISKR